MTAGRHEKPAICKLRGEYESRAHELRALVDRLTRLGHSDETIARTVSARRRVLAAVYKARTPEPCRSRIQARTLALYGDPLGPTIEYLREQGKSWAEIIDSAIRPGIALCPMGANVELMRTDQRYCPYGATNAVNSPATHADIDDE